MTYYLVSTTWMASEYFVDFSNREERQQNVFFFSFIKHFDCLLITLLTPFFFVLVVISLESIICTAC